ncbi:MAG TPA: ATP-binding protein, partial [Bacteroidia bacterium]
NAVTYTPEGSEIIITATTEKKENTEKLILTIEDSGPGFPADEVEKVFEKFYRLKNSATGGTGLGLSIVKGFVEAHNGTIQLSNSIKGGACFRIQLPVETSYINNLNNE